MKNGKLDGKACSGNRCVESEIGAEIAKQLAAEGGSV